MGYTPLPGKHLRVDHQTFHELLMPDLILVLFLLKGVPMHSCERTTQDRQAWCLFHTLPHRKVVLLALRSSTVLNTTSKGKRNRPADAEYVGSNVMKI